jgi:hypothetical protein
LPVRFEQFCSESQNVGARGTVAQPEQVRSEPTATRSRIDLASRSKRFRLSTYTGCSRLSSSRRSGWAAPLSILRWIYDSDHSLTAGMYVPHLDCLLVAALITVEGLDHLILKPKQLDAITAGGRFLSSIGKRVWRFPSTDIRRIEQ